MNKRFLLLLVAGCLLSNATSKAMQYASSPAGQGVIGLLGIGAIALTAEKLFKLPMTHALCNRLGFSPLGTKQVGVISTAALGLGYLTKGTPDLSNRFFRLVWKAPLFALLNQFTKKQIFREYVSKVPFIGEYMTCPLSTQEKVNAVKADMDAKNIDTSNIKLCKGTCEHCQSIDAIRLGLALTFIMDEVIPSAKDYLKFKFLSK